MIAMFAVACPNGWTEQTSMRGRFPRGEPNGDAASLGTGGSDDAVVVSHSHTTGSAGAHAHTQNVTANEGLCPGSGLSRRDFVQDTSASLCNYPQTTTSTEGSHAHSVSTVGSSATGANRPAFQEVIFCRKQ